VFASAIFLINAFVPLISLQNLLPFLESYGFVISQFFLKNFARNTLSLRCAVTSVHRPEIELETPEYKGQYEVSKPVSSCSLFTFKI